MENYKFNPIYIQWQMPREIIFDNLTVGQIVPESKKMDRRSLQTSEQTL